MRMQRRIRGGRLHEQEVQEALPEQREVHGKWRVHVHPTLHWSTVRTLHVHAWKPRIRGQVRVRWQVQQRHLRLRQGVLWRELWQKELPVHRQW